MKLSCFGEKMTAQTGILELMDDLGQALHEGNSIMLGGGNPAHIPAIEKLWRKRMQEILNNNGEYEKMLGNYTTPQGDTDFIKAITKLFRKQYGWRISEKNVAVLPGSQVTFFFLFNMLAGKYTDGSKKKVLLPIVPEYIGYEDQGIGEEYFTAHKPTITMLDKHTFKYSVDFDSLIVDKDVASICISRPTNPTGNVVTDAEVAKLSKLAKKHGIPFILDNAYGSPFPNIIFTKTTPLWEQHVIYVMSLSKLGLPSTRTSIVIANEEVVRALSSINAIVSLSTSTLGQHLLTPLVATSKILDISKKDITPFYQKKAERAIAHFHKEMKNSDVPYALHKSEGALFLWLWCKDLPISSHALYQKLKKKGVLVVPGRYFFPGLRLPWKHKDECVRITYSQEEKEVLKGLTIISKTLKEIYK